jgi:hypothetical protein
MGTSHHRRMSRLEAQHIYELAAATGRALGVSAEEILDEARRLFALPLSEQLAEVEALTPMLRGHGFTDADLADVRETLIRHDRPMA